MEAIKQAVPAGRGGNTAIVRLTRFYEQLVMVLVALSPLPALAYLWLFNDGSRQYVEHGFHEAFIALAILQSGFVSYITWRCYVSFGESLLRWLTLSFLGFTLIYAPHGLFTGLSDTHLGLFLFYGPVSRLTMAGCLLAGLLLYGKPAHDPDRRTSRAFWFGACAVFLAIDVVVGMVALQVPLEMIRMLRVVVESSAMLLLLAGICIILLRKIRSWIMKIYMIALAYLAQGSLAFILAKPWDQFWWLAHFIGAVGFTVLSYGVVRAFLTTRAFSMVYNQEEMMAQLADMTEQLRIANANLETLAATDPLTGLNNRRNFIAQGEAEFSRAARAGKPLTVLLMDIDHFKQINDGFGHAAGDVVLVDFANRVSGELRPSDHVGRWGGEEFIVLLPETPAAEALAIAERIRSTVQSAVTTAGAASISYAVSIGLAVFPADGRDLEEIVEAADKRLYQAKENGRNRVVAA